MSFDMNIHVERRTSGLERAPRTSRACGLCHTRKVRCDISPTKPQCSNCHRDNLLCEPRPRQRKPHPHKAKVSALKSPANDSQNATKRVETSTPAPRSDLLTTQQTAPLQNEGALSTEVESTQPLQRRTLQGIAHSEGDHRQGPSPSAGSMSSVCSSYDCGYMQRSVYIAPDDFRAEDGSEINYVVPFPSEVTRQIATLQDAFKFPPRAMRDSLFENFWRYCYPWDPIIDRSQVMGRDLEKVSPLLLQSVLLAGSRMASPSQPRIFASSQDYYTRAKTLFWLDYEKNPMNLLVASSLLHWWNPHGPERVSTNTSSFWCRITASIAQQMGLHSSAKAVPNESLRRRVWWSIVARDCLISVAHGRPQAISVEECDVARPTLADFAENPSAGAFFIAYVDLSLIMGRFTRHKIRKAFSRDSATAIEDSLYRWSKNLPEQLQLSDNPNIPMYPSSLSSSQTVKAYHLESRQLNVLYFTTIILLYRSESVDGPFPMAAVMAASTIAGMFEDFLARDEVRFLGACFSFHLLAASIALLACHRYPHLWALAQEDLNILAQAQEEMKKRWPSAIGSIVSFERMLKLTMATQKQVPGGPEGSLTPHQTAFFDICDMALCRLYPALVQRPEERESFPMDMDKTSAAVVQTSGGDNQLKHMMTTFYSQGDHVGQAPFLGQADAADLLASDQMFQEDALASNGAMGDWLFWDQLNFNGV